MSHLCQFSESSFPFKVLLDPFHCCPCEHFGTLTVMLTVCHWAKSVLPPLWRCLRSPANRMPHIEKLLLSQRSRGILSSIVSCVTLTLLAKWLPNLSGRLKYHRNVFPSLTTGSLMPILELALHPPWIPRKVRLSWLSFCLETCSSVRISDACFLSYKLQL